MDEALATVDAARKTQMTALGLQEPAKKAPATLTPVPSETYRLPAAAMAATARSGHCAAH